jgi:hypothetical protein
MIEAEAKNLGLVEGTPGSKFSDATSEGGFWSSNIAIVRTLKRIFPCLALREKAIFPGLQVSSLNQNQFMKAISSLPESTTSITIQGVSYLPPKFGLSLPKTLLRLYVSESISLDHTTTPTLPRSLTELHMSGQYFSKQSFEHLPRGLIHLELFNLKKLYPVHCRLLPPHMTHLSLYVSNISQLTTSVFPSSIKHLELRSNPNKSINSSLVQVLPPNLLSFYTDFKRITPKWLASVLPKTLTRLETSDSDAEVVFKEQRYFELLNLDKSSVVTHQNM